MIRVKLARLWNFIIVPIYIFFTKRYININFIRFNEATNVLKSVTIGYQVKTPLLKKSGRVLKIVPVENDVIHILVACVSVAEGILDEYSLDDTGVIIKSYKAYEKLIVKSKESFK